MRIWRGLALFSREIEGIISYLMTERNFYKMFLERKGVQMLLGSGLSKILGFVSVLIVTHWSTEQSFGSFSYAQSIVNAIIPLMGVGAYQAYVRYAADSADVHLKQKLYAYAYSRGMLFSMLLAVLLFFTAPLICGQLPESIVSFQILSFTVVTTLFMEYVKSHARSMHKNDYSGWIDTWYAISLVVLSLVLTLLYGVKGYAVAILISPVIAALPYSLKLNAPLIIWPRLEHVVPSGFWKYGIFTSIGAIIAQMFFTIDVIQMGRLIVDSEKVIALYRISVIVPMAMLILPSTIAATDYVSNSEMKHNAAALRNYMRGYWKVMIWLTPLLLVVVGLLAPHILRLFGPYYASQPEIMYVALIGVGGGYLLRVPFGNLLSAVGRADINTYVNIGVLVMAFLLCQWAIPIWGVFGAAVVMAVMMWVNGFASMIFFMRYYKGLPKAF
jgi:O-antigen/teichoic acid export membrane protein